MTRGDWKPVFADWHLPQPLSWCVFGQRLVSVCRFRVDLVV